MVKAGSPVLEWENDCKAVSDKEKLASPGVISQGKATGELLKAEGTLPLCPAWAAACYKGRIAI